MSTKSYYLVSLIAAVAYVLSTLSAFGHAYGYFGGVGEVIFNGNPFPVIFAMAYGFTFGVAFAKSLGQMSKWVFGAIIGTIFLASTLLFGFFPQKLYHKAAMVDTTSALYKHKCVEVKSRVNYKLVIDNCAGTTDTIKE